ncbi:MAG: alpha/beta fold hydrolase [Dehalococcoidia bacterium]
MIPETRYARSGDVHIAYQVSGDGPLDLVLAPGAFSHLVYEWESPEFAHIYQRLSSFTRLIRFDKRGTGMSDRVAGIAGLEERMDGQMAQRAQFSLAPTPARRGGVGGNGRADPSELGHRSGDHSHAPPVRPQPG